MTRTTRLMLVVATLVGHSVIAQRPTEFKANVKMVDASDGSTSTGMMYFGGAKTRTELTKDGQAVVVIADPAAKSQLILMPDDKMYMQMPMGQGPVNVPLTGPSDPTNPCSGGSGNTDCVKGAAESVNGHPTVKWEYTNQEGTRTRAWVSTKLRFPVKTEDDDGGKMEISNIAEGPQAASLFSVPAGYTKMDIGGFGAASGDGRGRGRGGRNADPMAEMMANLSPEMKAAMEKARRGEMPPGAREPASTTGSAWEKGKGWMLNVTVAGTLQSVRNDPPTITRSNYTVTYVATVPLNMVTPATGVPGTPGPIWTYGVGQGEPDVRKLPITLSAEAERRVDVDHSKGVCSIVDAPHTSVALMKTSARKSVPSAEPSGELVAQSMLKMSPDLKTFDLLVGVRGMPGYEFTKTRKAIGACPAAPAAIENKTDSANVSYGFNIDMKGIPLPSQVGPITGSRKMPVKDVLNRTLDATVTWNITPIR
jgi:hypothetical protein